MAGRIRTIKPEILEDEIASQLSDGAWRLWVSMWTLADDFGNLHAAPAKLTGQVFWGRAPAEPVAALLDELSTATRITLYRVNGSQYAHVNNWEKHQRIDNAGKNRVPPPEEADPDALAETRGDSPRTSADTQRVNNSRGSTSDLRPPTPTSDPDLRAQDRAHAHVDESAGQREQVDATKTAWAKAKLPPNGNDFEMGILSDEIQAARDAGERVGEPIPTLDEIMRGLKAVTDDWAKNGKHTKFQPSKLKDSIGLAIQVARGEVKLGAKSGGVAPKGTFTKDRDATEDV